MPSTSNEIERQDSALFRRFLRQCREYGPVRRPVNGLPVPFASLPCCPFRLRLTVWLIPRAFSFASSGNSERRSGHDTLNFIPLRRVRNHPQSDRLRTRLRSESVSPLLASQ